MGVKRSIAYSTSVENHRNVQRVKRVILAGGGLANGLIALRLAATRSDCDVVILESGAAMKPHTWSFHETDLRHGREHWAWALASATWDEHEVRFPGARRILRKSYAALRSGDFARRLQPFVRYGATVQSVDQHGVTLADGERLDANLVLDGRGHVPAPQSGWQTFLGQLITTPAPHGFERPILMDATLPQAGGYRFMYVLPWSPTTLLVEDTYYQETPALPEEAIRDGIRGYLRAHGISRYTVDAEERAALPIPSLSAVPPPAAAPGVARVGVAAGLYHPTTGYSFPEAVRVADLVAGSALDQSLVTALNEHARRRWRAHTYCRRLNNMLFSLPASGRRAVLARFYERDAQRIGRFYAGRLTVLDRVVLMTGKPPMPVRQGLRSFFARAPALG